MNYRVLKDNNVFLITDLEGNIQENHPYGLGLYKKDTRFLSHFDIKLNGQSLICLSSDANETTNSTIILTNSHMEENEKLILWRESVEVKRERFIYQDVWYESFVLKNYYPKPIEFDFTVSVDVDFKDMFIVRGFENGEVGHITDRKSTNDHYTISYLGADNIERRTIFKWNTHPLVSSESGDFTFKLALGHEESETLIIAICAEIGDEKLNILNPADALECLKEQQEQWKEASTKIQTDHHQLQKLIDRGLDDMKLLLTDIGYGSFPVAGLPWFGVPFGRDSLIAALQMLSINPDVAKGTLLTMAAYQGKTNNSWRDEQPGKIMHEIRFGELANTDQIPFTPYYGSIDSTPLFLVLLVEYCKWTGDLNLLKRLLPNVRAALTWIDEFGDRDQDGFVEYHQESSKGIANQGWKDSGDSIVHRNGDYANTPIALAEVQGYVYQAKIGLSQLFELIGEKKTSSLLLDQANELKQSFEDAFWIADQQFYAIALDQNKDQVGTITSNPGHLLLSGILSDERSSDVTTRLLSPKMFSGYGIRTMGEGEAGYNPMSYHDGSVWPHDNSLIFLGMSLNGYHAEASRVIEGLILASEHFEYGRLPELFCGYKDELGYPVEYPVACSPQAWAAGTPFFMVQALLGLKVTSFDQTVKLDPHFPSGMSMIEITNMSIGNGSVSFKITCHNGKYSLDVIENLTSYHIIFEGINQVYRAATRS